MRGTIILIGPDRFDMTRTASTTTTTTTTVFSSSANTTHNIGSDDTHVPLLPAHANVGAHTPASSVLAVTRQTARSDGHPTASASSFHLGGADRGAIPSPDHATVGRNPQILRATGAPYAIPAGTPRSLLPPFPIRIHSPGTLKDEDFTSAQDHLILLDRQLAAHGPEASNLILASTCSEGRGEWLKQTIRLMLETDPALYPPDLPTQLIALGLPKAAARTFLAFAVDTRRRDLQHHATTLFGAMDHTTRIRLLHAAHLAPEKSEEIANAFATHMLGNMYVPLQTGALMTMLALRPNPDHLLVLVDERFSPPLQNGRITSSMRHDEAEAFMDQPGHRRSRKMARELIHQRSANPARHVELLAGYLAEHRRMPEGIANLLSHALRNIAGNRELPDHVTAQDIAHGTASRWMGPHTTQAVARTMGKNANERLQALLAHGVAANVPDARGFTALHYAIAAGNVEGVRLLLQYGADPLHAGQRRLWPFGGTLRGLPPGIPLKFAQALLARQRSSEANGPLREALDLLTARANEIRTDAGQPLIAVVPETSVHTAHPLLQASNVSDAVPLHGRSMATQPAVCLSLPTNTIL